MRIERDWVPGERAGYHTHTTWYLLGELIERITGVRHDEWIRANLLEPAGMQDTWLAMSPERYHAYGLRVGFLYDTSQKIVPPKPLLNADTELAASHPRPSGSSLVRQVPPASVYREMLRHKRHFDDVRQQKKPFAPSATRHASACSMPRFVKPPIGDSGSSSILRSTVPRSRTNSARSPRPTPSDTVARNLPPGFAIPPAGSFAGWCSMARPGKPRTIAACAPR